VNAAQLPNRRVEAWKYSDLRAAIGDAPYQLRDGRDIIERLAPETAKLILPAGKQHVLVARLFGGALEAQAAEISLEPGATLTRILLQSGDGVSLSTARVKVEAGAKFRQIILSEGARLARIETHVSVEGDGAHVDLNGIYMIGAGRHADLTSVIEHKVGGGTTRQLIKGVARKGGRGVFQGKIVVAPQAQKTDARQYHHGMLLEDGAEIFAKPELMIHADDVQCAHGNTAGGLDERALFYMRSRGLPEAEARALLIEAFLMEAIPDGLDAAIRDELMGRIGAWLREARS
jgi:Fe-S cluster assembly protein SufD